MPFVPAPNVAMVEFRCSRNGQNVENRIMVNMLAEPTAADMSDLSVAAWNWWELDHADMLPGDVGLREVVVTSQHTVDGPQVTYAPDTTTTGNVGGFALPNEVSYCISLRSANRGRSARGRWYMLGLADGQLADTNNVTSAYATAAAASLQALVTAINASWQAVIVSYRSAGVPRPGGPVYFPIVNAVTVDTVLDSMRKRKPGVGT